MSPIPNISELKDAIVKGDRVALGQAITLVESTKEEHRELAETLLESCSLHAIKSRRIGITGVPGVGKSTFIDAFGSMLMADGHRVAVLAVDPSSDISKGSILGDKTRMERLSMNENAFVRPTAAGGSLGGVARKTRETIILCEAAGFDTILIETVGVGQSETAVHSMVDLFVLLVLATAGDELQGIKRGIMEMADLIIINKDDGQNASYSKLAKASYQQALHLFPSKSNEWIVPVKSCSSINELGLTEIKAAVNDFFTQMERSGWLTENRKQQNGFWLKQAISEELSSRFYNDKQISSGIDELERSVRNGIISPFAAARKLVTQWRQSN